MVRVLGFHCRDHGFDPQSGNYDPTSCVTWPKNREGGRKEDKKCDWGLHVFVDFVCRSPAILSWKTQI